jgi:hypothetical protein
VWLLKEVTFRRKVAVARSTCNVEVSLSVFKHRTRQDICLLPSLRVDDAAKQPTLNILDGVSTT